MIEILFSIVTAFYMVFIAIPCKNEDTRFLRVIFIVMIYCIYSSARAFEIGTNYAIAEIF